MQTVYEAAGGDSGVLRLATAWHRRVMADEVVSHAFSHGFHPQHSERLAAYWGEALGGPPTYCDTLGDETSVVRMHSGNGEHHEMDRRAIVCFDQALTDVGLAENRWLRQVLHNYFAWATTTTMSRYHRSADDVPTAFASRTGHGTDSRAEKKHTAGLGPASSCVTHVAFPIAIGFREPEHAARRGADPTVYEVLAGARRTRRLRSDPDTGQELVHIDASRGGLHVAAIRDDRDLSRME